MLGPHLRALVTREGLRRLRCARRGIASLQCAPRDPWTVSLVVLDRHGFQAAYPQPMMLGRFAAPRRPPAPGEAAASLGPNVLLVVPWRRRRPHASAGVECLKVLSVSAEGVVFDIISSLDLTDDGVRGFPGRGRRILSGYTVPQSTCRAQARLPSAVRLKVLSHRVERLIQESACVHVDLVPQRAILTLWRLSLPWRGSVVSC